MGRTTTTTRRTAYTTPPLVEEEPAMGYVPPAPSLLESDGKPLPAQPPVQEQQRRRDGGNGNRQRVLITKEDLLNWPDSSDFIIHPLTSSDWSNSSTSMSYYAVRLLIPSFSGSSGRLSSNGMYSNSPSIPYSLSSLPSQVRQFLGYESEYDENL